MPATERETYEQLLARLEKARGIFREMKAKELRDREEYVKERDRRIWCDRVLDFLTAICNGDTPPPNEPDHPLVKLVDEVATEASGRIHPSIWAARRIDLIRRITEFWAAVVVGPGLAPDKARAWDAMLRECQAEITFHDRSTAPIPESLR